MRRRNARMTWGALLLAPFLIIAAIHQGCSASGGYEDARAKMGSIIVSPETLNGWLAQGYGTDSFGYDRLVVLDVSSRANYAAGHVPGAFHVDAGTEVNVSRSDGIGGTYSWTHPTTSVVWTEINAPAQVATREMMDGIIRRTGITRSTVVAIVGDSVMNAGLLYFNFRYWGFPRERLRVLDRTKKSWNALGYPLSTDTPAPVASTYGVCELTQNTSLRASLADMIQLADGALGPKDVAWDVRTLAEYNGVAGKTAGPFAGANVAGQTPVYTEKVAFEGHVKGAVQLNYEDLLVYDAADTTKVTHWLLDEGGARAKVQEKGFLPDVRTFIYCRTGGRAAVSFLVMDGMLGYPAKLYDASWMEWGQMATSAKDGALTADSTWRTDNGRSEPITYAVDNALTVSKVSGASSYSRRADMVTVTDAAACGGTGGGDKRPVTPGY